jgi:hypothetical protein
VSAQRIATAVGVAALAAATAATAASGAKRKSPVVKGGLYKGALAAPRTAFTIAFNVSKNGKQVTGLKINNLPIYCSGGGPTEPMSFKNATISKSFSFESTAVQTIKSGSLKGQKGATLTLTGTFRSRRRESGQVTTAFPTSDGTSCNGTSSYSTKA